MNENNIKIAVVGEDARQRIVASELLKRGYETLLLGADGDASAVLENADVAVLPLPASRDGFKLNSDAGMSFESFADLVPKHCRVFCGRLQPSLKDILLRRGISVYDFYGDEKFASENTDISADGTVARLSDIFGGMLDGKNILVCGYGMFGRAICKRLSEMGTSVTVAARREISLDRAMSAGFDTLKIDLAEKCFFRVPRDCHAVLNTVPYHIFTDENSESLRGKLYLELASAPYGGSPERLKGLCRYEYLPSIPSRFAPERAGQAMLGALLRYIRSVGGADLG